MSILNTDDQQRIAADGERLRTLIANHPRFATVLDAMAGTRRMYVVFFRELQAIVEELTDAAKVGEEISDTFADFAVQYVLYESSKPFNEHQLMQHDVMNVLVPAVAAVVDRHTQQEANEAMAERAEAALARQDSPVQIGFSHSPHQTEPTIRRDRTLVLTGWRNAIMYVADQAIEAAMKAGHQVLRFMSSAPKAKEQHHQLIRVGANGWKGVANSDRSFDMCLTQYVANKVSGLIDLLVIDDLGATFTSSFLGRPAAACAGDGQRRLRKWGDKQGVGIIGLLPTTDKTTPDTTALEFEQLRTFCDLRAVKVELDLDSDNYRITVGRDAAVFDVDRQTLDNYRSVLAVPNLEIE